MAEIEEAEAEAANSDVSVAEDAPVEIVCQDELDKYLSMPRQPISVSPGSSEVNNPLSWWQLNQQMFPVLARLARMYLAIQATSAPSERLFSIASLIIRSGRARLDPYNAGTLLYIAQYWKHEREREWLNALAEDDA